MNAIPKTFLAFPALAAFLAGLKGAWNFLTVFRLGRSVPPGPWALAWFPVVGAVLAMVAAEFHAVSFGRVPLAVEAALMVAGWAVVTGALHLDGLADVCDAAYAGHTPDEARRIMKDPHIGTMGVVALACVLLIKWSCFWAIGAHREWIGWLAAPVIGRCAMGWTLVALPYVGSAEGTARPFLNGSLRWPVWTATVFTVVWIVWALGPWGVAVGAGGALTGGGFIRMARRRFGGCTGDVVGASGEFVETVAWIVTAVIVCGGGMNR